jgi:hypothetical protein
VSETEEDGVDALDWYARAIALAKARGYYFLREPAECVHWVREPNPLNPGDVVLVGPPNYRHREVKTPSVRYTLMGRYHTKTGFVHILEGEALEGDEAIWHEAYNNDAFQVDTDELAEEAAQRFGPVMRTTVGEQHFAVHRCLIECHLASQGEQNSLVVVCKGNGDSGLEALERAYIRAARRQGVSDVP